jgi:hypothetical protein
MVKTFSVELLGYAGIDGSSANPYMPAAVSAYNAWCTAIGVPSWFPGRSGIMSYEVFWRVTPAAPVYVAAFLCGWAWTFLGNVPHYYGPTSYSINWSLASPSLNAVLNTASAPPSYRGR